MVTLEWGHYAKPRNPRLQLWTSDGPMATASVNPDMHLADGLIAIKDWHENTGVLAALVKAGIVEDTGEVVSAGYEVANVCRILTHELTPSGDQSPGMIVLCLLTYFLPPL